MIDSESYTRDKKFLVYKTDNYYIRLKTVGKDSIRVIASRKKELDLPSYWPSPSSESYERFKKIKTNEKILLLDTPGVLWPKLEGDSGLHLSFTNAIKDEILNVEELCLKFLEFMKEFYPDNLKERYKIDPTSTAIEIYDQIGLKRGAIIRKGEVDYTRCANLIFNDFRSGKLGRITIEKA